MTRKPTLNLAVSEPLLVEFNQVCRAFGHNKQKGQVLSAALMMFLQTDPRDQGHWVRRVVEADIDQGVEELLMKVRQQQGLHVAHRDALERVAALPPAARPAQAAKKRQPAQRPLKKLPPT
ncbi:MAG: hypothetical protein AAGG38_14595 [Planctomycetota bacterium]